MLATNVVDGDGIQIKNIKLIRNPVISSAANIYIAFRQMNKFTKNKIMMFQTFPSK
jgi:hypothetical protein